MQFQFSPNEPRLWTGRYARIPGDTTVLHVRLFDGQWWPFVDWVRDDETGHCPMLDGNGAAELVEAVHAGKRFLGGTFGGAFQINEYGQVLVPSSAGGEHVALVGECRGPLLFENVFEQGTFDLTDARALQCGDAWQSPYLGIRHNLSAASEIYFWNEGNAGAWKMVPPRQDLSLIHALRSLRPYGAVRFVVGFGGLVLTKVPVGDWRSARWEPRFVTHVDYQQWYPKVS